MSPPHHIRRAACSSSSSSSKYSTFQSFTGSQVRDQLSMSRAESNGSIMKSCTNGVHHEKQSTFANHGTNAASISIGDYIKLLTCSACGFVFGIAAEKAKVHVPSVIKQQMLFNQNTMLKAFLAAVTTSIAMFSLLYLLPFTQSLFKQVRVEFGGCVTAKKMISFVAGGVILGMGMTVSGACPGMVMVQAGAGYENSLITLLGCFTGTVLYGALEPYLRRHIATKKHSHMLKSIWLDQIVGVHYISLAVTVAIMICAIIVTVESIVPWTTDSVPVSSSEVGLLAQKSWSPIYAGILMGSLQLPIALIVHDSLGGSSSYCTLISQSTKLSQAMPYFTSFSRGGISTWWQVFYWGGAAGGAALSASMSGLWGQSTGVYSYSAFLGGAMMLFGARLASGCTSGHGLSGLALLSLASYVAVPAMFAGGISLAGTIKLFSSIS